MFDDARPSPVEAGCRATILRRGQRTRPFGYRSGQALPVQHRSAAAFTLTELLVAMAVVVLLVLLFTQLLKSATTIMTLGHKQMDADSQARQLLDRMAMDFAQMVKRSDVDYYVKSSWFATGSPPGPTGVRRLPQPGNDKIAFYSAVSGYYPSTGSQSPVSLVGYRINSQNTLERMSKGLVWNAVSTTDTPIVFIPVPLASPLPTAELPVPPPNPLPTPAWLEIASPGTWSGSEVIGPQVFRFEYYYLLKGQIAPESAPAPTATPYNAILSDAPWDTRICSCPTPAPTASVSPAPTATPTPIPSPTPPAVCCHVAPEGMQDVAAVVVVIAVIDPKSKSLLSDTQIAQVASQLIDWGDTTCAGCPTQTQWQTTSGLLRARWQSKLDSITNLPRPAISGIRVYERYLYLSPPTLLTP
jgi:type II secretory pathway pseudopilin PulG